MGFVSAILAESSLPEVLAEAQQLECDCVELMCWPVGKADRRYAGVTHIDVTDGNGLAEAGRMLADSPVAVSALGYYPNPLSPDTDAARTATEHIHRVIDACASLTIPVFNTFIGRNPSLSIDDNWDRCLDTWGPLVDHAEECGIRIGIENCPMLFTEDEWPGGHNLATSPAIWRRLFNDLPSPALGLNYDPSHLVWQHMDHVSPIAEFADRIVHLHAKDARIDADRLDDVGILATPLSFHTPVLPGRGAIDWSGFFQAVAAIGYEGSICVEVEDREYEATHALRIEAIRQSLDHLHSAWA